MAPRININRISYIQLSGELFKDVQMQRIFSDSLTFVDSVPKNDPLEITKKYLDQRGLPSFDLKQFVFDHFHIPSIEKYEEAIGEIGQNNNMDEAIEATWDVLKRTEGNEQSHSTLINLPSSYIVPGGRFRALYYWDTYFTSLGLVSSGHSDIVVNMCDNFCYLIDKLGFIPNGNRVYFSSRSQPPVFPLLVELIVKDEEAIKKYLPYCESEYKYWMNGYDKCNDVYDAVNKSVLVGDDEVLSRYYDPQALPREESYYEDIHSAKDIREDLKSFFYQELRSGAESGWDYSSRWFTDHKTISTIRTTEICPIDLNSLLYIYELKLSKWNKLLGHPKLASLYESLALKRKAVIQKYCYSQDKGFFFDYSWSSKSQTEDYTLAGTFPLFANLATQEQSNIMAKVIAEKFLFDGGLVTTLNNSGEQWDYPNGWAPLQWIAIQGLRNYGHHDLADNIKEKWLTLCENKYKTYHCFAEKYNVVDVNAPAIQGEYENQIGFGWTNGVVQALLNEKHTQK
ncbi:MAG: trehalase [bacterium]|nr:trehalase [bacterium]